MACWSGFPSVLRHRGFFRLISLGGVVALMLRACYRVITEVSPMSESVGDVFYGIALVHANWSTDYDGNGILRLDKGRPKRVGLGHAVQWTETQTREGWTRKVTHVLHTNASDPTRATAKFVITSVEHVASAAHDPMHREYGFGGGMRYVAKRLCSDGTPDPDGEEILYTRGCAYNTDIRGNHAPV